MSDEDSTLDAERELAARVARGAAFPTLTAALADAQAAMPTIPKGKTATVQGKPGKQGYSYQYADIADVLAVVRPVLGERGLVITQRTAYDEGGRLMLRTELRHVSGELLDSEVELNANPGSPQQFGSSLTYLRRYELVTLLGLAAEEDTDAQHVDPTPASGYGQPPARVEPPAWAAPAEREHKAAALDALHRVIGDRDIARGYLGALAQSIDGLPAVFAQWLAALPAYVEQAGRAGMLATVEPPPAAPAEPAPAKPDEGAPASDVPSDWQGPTEEELAEARAARRADEVRHAPDAELGPASGSVELTAEDLVRIAGAENTDERVLIMRELGCICEEPLNQPDEPGHDDACPIKGHGIPF